MGCGGRRVLEAGRTLRLGRGGAEDLAPVVGAAAGRRRSCGGRPGGRRGPLEDAGPVEAVGATGDEGGVGRIGRGGPAVGGTALAEVEKPAGRHSRRAEPHSSVGAEGRAAIGRPGLTAGPSRQRGQRSNVKK
ncbi:hypothetical protein BBAL3_544 [Brevundimonas sp. BAL3]|nr:hypothetical protein BBAL3_544 [Brevundimonas sp. BAL3]